MFTGEFDDEFLAELKSMETPRPVDTTKLTTVASEAEYEAVVAAATAEIEAAKAQDIVKRKKTYLNSEIPVRPCTDTCPKRDTCRDFSTGRVSDLELCRPELRQIKKWQKAFRSGNTDEIKDDAGAVAASLAIQIQRLIEQAILDGAVVETTRESKFGNYKEKMAHPALQQAANICKTLGINLSEFLMTPKSQKDAGPMVQVNIGISAEEVNARFAARYGQQRDPVNSE